MACGPMRIEQARVAATNAVGQMAFFQGCVPVTILKCLGIPLVSIGDILEDGDGHHFAECSTTQRGIHIAASSSATAFPVGAILLGTSRGMGDVHKLIAGGLQLERLRQQVVADDSHGGGLMKPSAFLDLPGLAVGSGTVLLLGLGILLGSRNLRTMILPC